MRILTLSLVLTSFCFQAFDKSFEKLPPNNTATAANTPQKPLLLASLDKISLQSPSNNYATEWGNAVKQNATISNEQGEHKKYWLRDHIRREYLPT